MLRFLWGFVCFVIDRIADRRGPRLGRLPRSTGQELRDWASSDVLRQMVSLSGDGRTLDPSRWLAWVPEHLTPVAIEAIDLAWAEVVGPVTARGYMTRADYRRFLRLVRKNATRVRARR